jgi:hypothetical protein
MTANRFPHELYQSKLVNESQDYIQGMSPKVLTNKMVKDPTGGEMVISSASRSVALGGSNHDEPIHFEQQVRILDHEASMRRLKVQSDLRSLSGSRSGSSLKGDITIMLRPQRVLDAISSRPFTPQPAKIVGADPVYLDDEKNYNPNTDYSVTLDLRKEYIRHKRIICSIKELNNYDLQNRWDIAYSQSFAGHS